VAPESAKVAQGFASEDIFTVVLEHFQTDTADYADWLLPATTQLEHVDVVTALWPRLHHEQRGGDCADGRVQTQHAIFRELSLRMGLDDDLSAATATTSSRSRPSMWTSACAGLRLRRESLQAGLDALEYCAVRCGAVRQWRLPDSVGALRVCVERAGCARTRPAAGRTCRLTSRRLDSPLAVRFPLSMISPPARNFMNSTFVNVTSLRNIEGVPALSTCIPTTRASVASKTAAMVRVFNDRGSQQLQARVTARARRGVVVAPSIWWKKLSPDGRNANELTSQALTDMGRAPTFYDTRVEVEAA
jgi:anaerobic selenocysteine-containing dehydrogenase